MHSAHRSERRIIVMFLAVVLFLAAAWSGVNYLIATTELTLAGQFNLRNPRIDLISSAVSDVIKRNQGKVVLVLLPAEDYWDLRFEYYHAWPGDELQNDFLPSSPDEKKYYNVRGADLVFSFQNPIFFDWERDGGDDAKAQREEESRKILSEWNAAPDKREKRRIDILAVPTIGGDGKVTIREFTTDGGQVFEETR